MNLLSLFVSVTVFDTLRFLHLSSSVSPVTPAVKFFLQSISPESLYRVPERLDFFEALSLNCQSGTNPLMLPFLFPQNSSLYNPLS